jgi:Eukaryotic translation initiation factor 3 subunit 7 (eIF-3)
VYDTFAEALAAYDECIRRAEMLWSAAVGVGAVERRACSQGDQVQCHMVVSTTVSHTCLHVQDNAMRALRSEATPLRLNSPLAHVCTPLALLPACTPLAAGTVEWRQKLDAQRGAVLATELKNNAAKLAKWTAQSIIAGADQASVAYSGSGSANAYQSHVHIVYI